MLKTFTLPTVPSSLTVYKMHAPMHGPITTIEISYTTLHFANSSFFCTGNGGGDTGRDERAGGDGGDGGRGTDGGTGRDDRDGGDGGDGNSKLFESGSPESPVEPPPEEDTPVVAKKAKKATALKKPANKATV